MLKSIVVGKEKDRRKKAKMSYKESLDKVHRDRYNEKMQDLNGLDPYEIAMEKWSSETDDFPSVNYISIVNYLLFKTSAYTQKQFQNYRSQEGYQQLVNGFVSGVSVYHEDAFGDKYVLIGKVMHSQRLSEKPLNPWVIADNSGTVISAHCNCMAGLGESCTHVAALLYYIDSAVRLRDQSKPTVTESLSYWPIPTGLKKVEYSRMYNIDLESSVLKKKKLDKVVDSGGIDDMQIQNAKTSKVDTTPAASHEDVIKFGYKLVAKNIKASWLGSTPEFMSVYKVNRPGRPSHLISLLDKLKDPKCADMSLYDLIYHCKSIDIEIDEEEVKTIELRSRGQGNNIEWFTARVGRITASNLHQVLHTDPTVPSYSLIKKICYPNECQFSTPATRYGKEKEAEVREMYLTQMTSNHDGFHLDTCGFCIDPTLPFMGASPDAKVVCACCGNGCVEIKCPLFTSDKTLEQAIQSNTFCCHLLNGSIQLKQTHPYYSQVQCQIFITGSDYCDFVILTSNQIHVERIEPNITFWNDAVPKVEQFYKLAILPELVGQYFSVKNKVASSSHKIFSSKQCTSAGESNTTNDSKLWCYCQQPERGRMIGCDGKKCKYSWFHYKCVNLKRNPSSKTWFCPECAKLKQ